MYMYLALVYRHTGAMQCACRNANLRNLKEVGCEEDGNWSRLTLEWISCKAVATRLRGNQTREKNWFNADQLSVMYVAGLVNRKV